MIETLQNNLELFVGVFTLIGVPTFIYIMTALVKDKLPMYTPHIAILMGMVTGFLLGIPLFGFGALATPMTIIQGAILGAAAVGFHQAGNKPEVDEKVIHSEVEELLAKLEL